MKNFNWKKYIFAVIAAFVAFQAMDYLVHTVILNEKYQSLNDTGIWRENMQDYMWIMFVTGIIFAVFFVYLYHYFSNAYKTGWMAGLYYGLVIAFMTSVIGAYGQFMVYNLPYDLAWQWALYGLIETAIVGIIVGLIYKPLSA